MPVTERRKTRHLALGVAALALASALSVAPAATAGAADVSYDFLAGEACDFALHAEGTGGIRITREFTDEDGNLVRILSAGKGFDLTFTNVETGKTLELSSNGSVARTITL
jgi:hypothetical protein